LEKPVRAIQTPYQGYRFRSRLEARWAVFLDSLGIEYWYEFEGVKLAMGGYLPDFYLPQLGYWLEVKGPKPTDADRMKAYMLSLESVFEDPEDLEDLDASIQNSTLVYILYGDIPYPYPKQGNAIGYGAKALGFDLDPDPEDMYGGIGGLCWQRCPICLCFGIGPINEVFCKQCLTGVVDGVEEKVYELGYSPSFREEVFSEIRIVPVAYSYN